MSDEKKYKLFTLDFLTQNFTKYGWMIIIYLAFFVSKHQGITTKELLAYYPDILIVPLGLCLPVWVTQFVFFIYGLITKNRVYFLSYNEAKELPEDKKYRFFYALWGTRKIRFGAAYIPDHQENFFLIPAFVYFVSLLTAIALGIIIYLEKGFLTENLLYDNIFTFDWLLALGTILALLGHKKREKW